MSSPTTVQGRNTPLAMSTDDVTFKNILCNRAHNYNASVSTTDEESDCGVETATGAITATMDFDGLLNTTPNGATEMSFDAVHDLFLAKTLVYIKTQPGIKIISGDGYITNMTFAKATANLNSFTFTFKFNGDPIAT